MAVGQPTGPCPISTRTGTPAAVLPVPHLWPVAAGAGDCAAEVAAAGFAARPVLHPVSAHPASAARASAAGKAAPAGRKGGRRMGVSFRAPHHAVIRGGIRGRLPVSRGLSSPPCAARLLSCITSHGRAYFCERG